MIKKELTVRERRKIYEDAIYVIAQTHKIQEAGATKERALQNMIKKQMDKCMSILATALGYQESVLTEENGMKRAILVPIDQDENYVIDKKKFEEIAHRLCDDKELKETLWKSVVKRDKKMKTKFDDIVA